MATEVRSSLEQAVHDLSEWTPEWEKAQTFPVRYPCTEEEYLTLDLNVLLEFTDGFLEMLPMPTIHHQRISAFLFKTLSAWVAARQLGEVLYAPLRVLVRKGKYREPDLVFMRSEQTTRMGDKYWEHPDLVIEIVSEKNRRHDLETKRDEYARAAIPEYWIVDPEEETITVLVLKPKRKTYAEHVKFTKGERAASKLLRGFAVDVSEALSPRP